LIRLIWETIVMAKNGKLKPAAWGRFMPVQNPQSEPGPWHYRGTEMVMVEFPTDEKAALAVLPSDLELVEPATAFMVIETNHWTTLGPYSEVYVGILCTWKGELYGYAPGVYVTGENSQIVGREVYGFGKKRPHRIELIKHSDGSVEAAMDVKPGDQALRATMRPHQNQPAEAISALPLICLKVVPDAEGSAQPSLAQLVSVLFKANAVVGSDGKAEVYTGPGHMQFGSPSDVQFPIKGEAKFTYAHFHADLPYGKILKTYSSEELKACV
jgi:acetoacetate decarboxylase